MAIPYSHGGHSVCPEPLSWVATPAHRHRGRSGSVQISARSDYAIRAALELASHYPELAKVENIAAEQELPRKFLESILGQLRRAGLVETRRGCSGGYLLRRPPAQIYLGEIIRAVDGPLAEVRGLRPHETEYDGVATHLPDLWVAVRSSLRSVLDTVSLQQLLSGNFPAKVRRLNEIEDAWLPR
nr:Rrf2 family transcriptional regulator [Flexivirga aerilata]